MALKSWTSLLTLLALTSGCGQPASPPPEEEADPLSVTRWTERTELFAEYPVLVAGRTSRFAVHLTRLDTFKALADGTVEIRLEGGGGPPQTFRVDAPSRPGIFGVDVTPTTTGARELVIALRSRDVTDEHRVGRVEVYPDAEAARAATPAEDGAAGISFLKEQQWSLDFGTAVVGEAVLRESIRVPALLEPRPDGAADVIAPISGRLVMVLAGPIGASVTRGQEIARIAPPASVPGDLPELQRARTEADTALVSAVRDRERAERLTTAGAAPARRLEEAGTTEAHARARLAAAEASLAQYQAVRSGEAASDDGLFVVRAPIAGVISSRSATTGTNVSAGASLLRIVDASTVHVAGRIPEVATARARQARSAEVEMAGQDTRVPAGDLVSIGRCSIRSRARCPSPLPSTTHGPRCRSGSHSSCTCSWTRHRRDRSCRPTRLSTTRAVRSCSCSWKVRRSNGGRNARRTRWRPDSGHGRR